MFLIFLNRMIAVSVEDNKMSRPSNARDLCINLLPNVKLLSLTHSHTTSPQGLITISSPTCRIPSPHTTSSKERYARGISCFFCHTDLRLYRAQTPGVVPCASLHSMSASIVTDFHSY